MRPTTPPAAPSGQRAADVGRYGESSRAGPSVIGKLVCHVKTSPAHDSKPRDARYLDRETTRWNSRAPARQGPSPEERHPVYPQRFNWFESTPRNAPRLPIQTNNHTTSEPHTHVMSNENKFPLKKNRLSYYVLILKVKRHVFLKVRVDYKSSVDQKSGPTLVPRALGGNANDLQRAS